MWNVIFGRSVVVGGLGFGVERDEQASVDKIHNNQSLDLLLHFTFTRNVGMYTCTLFSFVHANERLTKEHECSL